MSSEPSLPWLRESPPHFTDEETDLQVAETHRGTASQSLFGRHLTSVELTLDSERQELPHRATDQIFVLPLSSCLGRDKF